MVLRISYHSTTLNYIHKWRFKINQLIYRLIISMKNFECNFLKLGHIRRVHHTVRIVLNLMPDKSII